MSNTARELLEQFSKLAASEQREVLNLLLREPALFPVKAAPRRRSIVDVAGKYRPTPNPEAANHDAGFAEAIVVSKTDPLAE
jgi:hypothetical protein